MQKVLITTSSFAQNDPAPLHKLQEKGLKVILNPYKRKLTEAEVTALLQEHDPCALLAGVEPLTAAALSAAPGLKVVSRCGIGLDSVDLQAAADLGIAVHNTPDAPTRAVAELTLGLILSLLRRIHLSAASIAEGRWERPMGNLLYGKTVGIIGCGRIGACLAEMLQAFNCRLLGSDPACPQSDCFTLTELDQLLAEADIISLHLPYNQHTHHFINAERLARLKKGAYLINAARGGLIDETALYNALKSGNLAGAALDTFEQEPYLGQLKDLNNTLLTAHIGSYASEARTMMEMQAVENLLKSL